jgi:DNA ligase (NAD+)
MAQYATPRHLAAATLRSQNPDPQALAVLRLFPFEYVGADAAPQPVNSDRAALQLLVSWGFNVPKEHTHPVRSFAEVETVYRNYLLSRDRQSFAMDGIVVKVDDLALRRLLGESARAPQWAAAWKFPPATAPTEILAIDWKIGRTGRRTPVAEVTPITLGGIQVQRVSLHNIDELARLGIAPGDQVLVALAGDAVPQVVKIVRKVSGTDADPLLAAPAPAVAIDACLVDAPGCREQFLARAVHFVSKAGLNIAGLSRGRLKMLVDAGVVADLPSLFRLTEEDIGTVPGFGPKTARQLTQAIRAAGHPELSQLLGALGIPGAGPAAVRRLGEHFSSLDALLSTTESELAAVTDIPPGTAKNIRSFFDSPGGGKLLADLREVGLWKGKAHQRNQTSL